MMECMSKTKYERATCMFFSLLILAGQYLCLDKPAQKQSVSTVLNGKWSLTPFALETTEFLGDVKNDYFWSLLDFLAEDKIINKKFTDEEFYEKLMEFSSRYVSI